MIPEFPNFKNLELSDKKSIDNFTKKHPPYSDFNFTSMWVWNTSEEIQISILNDNLVVKFTDYLNGDHFYSFLGTNKIKETTNILLDYTEKTNNKAELRLISQEIVDIHGGSNNTPDENNFDYIYDLKELSDCAGKKYETQRNLINRFKKRNTNHSIHHTDSIDDIKNHILDLNTRWKEIKEDKVDRLHSEKETRAIERIFEIKDNETFSATYVCKDEKLVAFIINEDIPDSEYAVSHFAKADTSIPGIYAYIINHNSKYLISKGKKYLNYEQDMGLKNLRYAKLSLNPKHFLKKHIVRKII